MRILKYLFLLFLLSLVALSIFIATQKGEFLIERSKIINSSTASVYNYVNDYRNWEDFGTWSDQDPEMKFRYPGNTTGKGASYSWEGKEGSGNMVTLFTKENDSIAQRMNFDGNTSTVNWKFKDTIGGTKVTWSTKGKMDFFFKIFSALNGGVDKVIGTMYEKSLVNLDKNLVYEIKTFSIKDDGLVTKPQLYYVAQTFTSEISKINKNFKIVVPKITSFCADNDINSNGNPFIIYHSYDTILGLAKISIALPIESEIFLSAGSDINSGKLVNFEAVKVTLTGDYSHTNKAYDKAIAVLNQKQVQRDPKYAFIAMYKKGRSEVRNPSKWITEFYIPLLPKAQPVREYIPSPQASTDAAASAEPLPAKNSDPAKAKKKVESKNTVAPKAIEEEFEF
ncbi:MAG: SRPBCC family protein [Bacteroidetes bacterium]|nr:SRPBCC family protein [Bacteroidota bacterium]